ncbi:16S rRNA (guanine(527)-N(7))-methyltransferase RsmG [Ideonella sp. BN130291]|nr:16S rRNA (guanine(527)-N(7))-methyltransferase RsmG [Ideonella sp. BN130291]
MALDPSAAERMLAYLQLLQRWNATYNLTAVRDPGQMFSHHLLDCVAVVPPLRRHLAGAAGRLLDVGSGGGLPGAVIAMLMPEVQVSCVDTVGKKAAFIRQVAGELGLRNLNAVHARVEQLDGRFDVITSRAFASLPDFCRLTRPLLAEQGAWMAMKGKLPADEMAALPSNIAVFHVEHLAVPSLDAERCLVWMRPAPAAGA